MIELLFQNFKNILVHLEYKIYLYNPNTKKEDNIIDVIDQSRLILLLISKDLLQPPNDKNLNDLIPSAVSNH